MSRNTITVNVYTNRGDLAITFPARFIVCEACDGHGTTTAHIEPDGGGFTASEWAEACGDDPDFEQDYFAGAYDRPCPTCKGQRVVQVIDREAVTGWRHRILLKEYDRQIADSAEIDAMHEAERRMGA